MTARNFIGEYKYLDVVIPGGVPRIISDELWNQVQEREDILLPALRQQLAEAEKGIENTLNAIQQALCQ